MIIPYKKITLISLMTLVLLSVITAQTYSSDQIGSEPFQMNPIQRSQDSSELIFVKIHHDRYVGFNFLPIILVVFVVLTGSIGYYARYGNTQEFRFFVNTAFYLAGFTLKLGRFGRTIEYNDLIICFDRFGRSRFTIKFPYREASPVFGLISSHRDGTGELTQDISGLQITLLQLHRYLQQTSSEVSPVN